ncbi:glycosyltransferase family 2 protein [Sulfuricurvum sp.]|uniref:glycosyltransferase family 2 protein n=1 Tax=Sulfuricurvum sp. TaxID=2025608 RepID=UPI00261C63D6|nr:glycosyltransferase family 2 protein [Sulfuricurvum sp.]MDD2266023.1 glycosyltransferase family 2 protein [Sulfuricurvum sp.]MDD2783035.1 glycosyltransferase family 2 protein [Sulfuricurvum sp.]
MQTPTVPFMSLICPCYNEQEVIGYFLSSVTPILESFEKPYEIIFINDGSRDNTFKVLLDAKANYPHIRIINLSRNFGKEAAMTAGLDVCQGEVVIPIDVDLQDPPELIKDFIQEYENGSDVVVARRVDRTSDSLAKKLSASYFYKLHNKISHVSIPDNVGDYRLMSRKVVTELRQLPENQRFMKGLFAWVGFKTAVVEYTRPPRKAGTTSFNGWKLWNFALDGITSFSTVPLRIWLYMGVIIAFLAFIYGSVIIVKTLIYGIDSPGYASLITIILFIGGIQLMGIGILGEYIGRIYMESKRRPAYIIENEY